MNSKATNSPATLELLRSSVMVAAAAAKKPSKVALSVLGMAIVIGVAAVQPVRAEGDSMQIGPTPSQEADWQAGNSIKNFFGLGERGMDSSPNASSAGAGPLSKIVGGAIGLFLGHGAGKAMGVSPVGTVATGALGAYAGVKVADHLAGDANPSPSATVVGEAGAPQFMPAVNRLGSNVLAYRALAEQTHGLYKAAVLNYALNPRDIELAKAVDSNAAAVNRDVAGLNVALKDLRQATDLIAKQYTKLPREVFAEHRRILAQGSLPLQVSADFSSISEPLRQAGETVAFAIRSGQVEHLGMIPAQAQNAAWRQAPMPLPVQQMQYTAPRNR